MLSLLAGGIVFVLIGVLLLMFELTVFGVLLTFVSVVFYAFAHRDMFE